jgi:hypothetical protein
MAERGREAPEAFYERPEIAPHLALIWDAFWELGTERQLGMSVGPIPGSKIREYVRHELGLHGAEYDRATAIIRKADNAWLGMLNARKGDEPKLADHAKATDPEGVKRVMRNLDRSFKAAKGRTTK